STVNNACGPSCSAPNTGSIGNPQTICEGGNPSTLTNGGTGGASTYIWQWSPNGSNSWTTISGATSSTYNPPAGLTVDRWYKRRGRASCSPNTWSSWSNTVKVTVVATPSAGTIGNPHTICSGGDPSTITNVAGGGASIFEWQWSPNGSNSWTTISGATSSTYNPPVGLTVDRWYKRRGRASCSPNTWSSWSNTIQVSIASSLNEGAIGSAQTICYNTSPTGLTNDITPTGGTGSYAYQWQSSPDNATWSNIAGATSATYSPGDLTTDTYYRRRVISCETKFSNSVLITVRVNLVAGAIGSAQTICYNTVPSGLTDDTSPTGGTGSYTYQWQSSTDDATWSNISGATSATYSPSNLTTSTYFRREVTSWLCESKHTSSILITVHPDLIPGTIGSNHTICYNEDPNLLTSDFDASGGDGTYTYQWHWSEDSLTGWNNISGATNSTYDPPAGLTEERFYRREVTSCGQTKYSEIITVSINELPVVNIGNDTIICRENDYVLNSNAPSAVIFEWNDLSTLSTLNTSGQGEYSVIVIDANGCTNYDTIQVDTFVSPVPILNIQDTAICFGESVTLEVDPIYNFYAWTNSGSFTNSTIVDETNEYILRIFDANGCFGSDTADVLVNNLPNAKIGDSIKFCLFKDLILTVPEQDAQYSWSTSGINRTEQIFGPGKYWVDVIDTNKCFNSDSVIVYEGEKIPVDLGNDTTICLGTTLTLDASFINTEIWQDIDTLSKYDVSVAGTYDVLVIDDEGCYGRDTIEISVSDIPVVEIVNGDSLPICELAFQEKTLSIIDNEGMNILWSNYDESDSIIVTNADFYTVSKTNQFYCTGYDTIEVYEYCRPVALTMPNIFTPNGDGINESFIPIEVPSEPLDYYMSHIKSIKFEIYNRWGRVLYSSSGILPNWDGINLNIGEPCASGTYYWTLIYSDVSGENYSKNGFVQIVR
ncbi:MAG: gliding motility-associated C-terminal domain-containing protein, partial [Flavobacteriales bacterium]|nr:gliding motility-associated C-terminal domain-containing protein [Flavobacteriales bacterium]